MSQEGVCDNKDVNTEARESKKGISNHEARFHVAVKNTNDCCCLGPCSSLARPFTPLADTMKARAQK